MQIPDSLLKVFPPSKDALLDLVRQTMDDNMLMDVARADYGLGADEVMPELRAIRDRGVVPYPLPSAMLSEVLSLTHYSNPDVPDPPPFAPGPTGLRGHQTRLFACAVLLLAEANEAREGFQMVTDSALANCLVSASLLGDDMSAAVGCFLTWRMPHQELGANLILMALGLLMLATRLRSGRFTEPSLGEIAIGVLSLESRARAAFPLYDDGLSFLSFSVNSGFWKPLVTEFRTEVESIRDEEVRTNLQLCAILLDE